MILLKYLLSGHIFWKRNRRAGFSCLTRNNSIACIFLKYWLMIKWKKENQSVLHSRWIKKHWLRNCSLWRHYTNLTHFGSFERLSCEENVQTQLCDVNWLLLVAFPPFQVYLQQSLFCLELFFFTSIIFKMSPLHCPMFFAFLMTTSIFFVLPL